MDLVTPAQHGLDVDVIYLDFWKVFDSIPHHRLIKKLEINLWNMWENTQRRSQVSLVGGADRIPGGGINLNTYTYKMSRRAA